MTERERYREVDGENGRTRQELYREVGGGREVEHRRVVGPTGDRIVHSERVREPSEAVRRGAAANRMKQVISFIFGAIIALIAIRFVLLLLGAGTASAFVQLIYGLSQPLTLPFQGMFGEPVVGASVIEWSSLVAIVVYSLIGYGLSRMIDLAFAPSRVDLLED